MQFNAMESLEKAPPAASQDQRAEVQFLTFAVGSELFGIEILKVQEIKGYTGFTPIPGAARHLRGLINLRGTIVPIVDLRCKFGLEEKDYDRFTVIVVITVGSKIVGLVVDAVSDVLSLPTTAIEPPPQLGGSANTSFIAGLAGTGERLVAILDTERLLAADLGNCLGT